jgi:hypothetical protein
MAGQTDLNGHKKTVSNHETVAGQQPEKTEKSTGAKTFRSRCGPLLSVPHFINW